MWNEAGAEFREYIVGPEPFVVQEAMMMGLIRVNEDVTYLSITSYCFKSTFQGVIEESV